jgi:hypothetical protein
VVNGENGTENIFLFVVGRVKLEGDIYTTGTCSLKVQRVPREAIRYIKS